MENNPNNKIEKKMMMRRTQNDREITELRKFDEFIEIYVKSSGRVNV